MMIAGGAAVALLWDDQRITNDVDVVFGDAFGCATSDVVDGGLVESHSYDGYSVQCRVGLTMSDTSARRL